MIMTLTYLLRHILFMDFNFCGAMTKEAFWLEPGKA
jgi:hypothetical protein